MKLLEYLIGVPLGGIFIFLFLMLLTFNDAFAIAKLWQWYLEPLSFHLSFRAAWACVALSSILRSPRKSDKSESYGSLLKELGFELAKPWILLAIGYILR